MCVGELVLEHEERNSFYFAKPDEIEAGLKERDKMHPVLYIYDDEFYKKWCKDREKSSNSIWYHDPIQTLEFPRGNSTSLYDFIKKYVKKKGIRLDGIGIISGDHSHFEFHKQHSTEEELEHLKTILLEAQEIISS